MKNEEWKMKNEEWKFLTLLFVVVRLPYLLLEFPGNIYPDTAGSIGQFFGYPDFSAQLCSTDPTVILTNHHPVIYTLLFGGTIALGNQIGSQSFAVFLFLLMLTAFHSWLLARIFILLKPQGGTTAKPYNRTWWLCVAFVAIFPIYGFWSTLLLKDAFFSTAFLWFTLCLLETELSGGQRLHDKSFLLQLFAATLLFLLSKNQCAYIVMLMLITLVLLRKFHYERLAFALLPALLVYECFLHLLLPALGVANVGRQELHGFLFQQAARYVKEFPDEVHPEEREAIARLLPYDRLANLYNPELQDPVKFSYNVNATAADYRPYYQAHLHMMLRHPGVAFASLWQNCSAYFYPSGRYPLFFPSMATDDPPTSGFYTLHPLITPQPSGMKAIMAIPLLGWLFDMGFYIPIALLGCIILFVQRMPLTILPLFISIGILILSPENGCFRYVMPILWLLPFEILLIVNNKTLKSNSVVPS